VKFLTELKKKLSNIMKIQWDLTCSNGCKDEWKWRS